MNAHGCASLRRARKCLVLGAVLVVGLWTGSTSLAVAAPSDPISVDENGIVDRRVWADVDGDLIPDSVEEELCGSASCARPMVDSDHDGISDWVEFIACGSATCATLVDSDRDCVPDYVSSLLCEGGSCSRAALSSDKDEDGIANWVEIVVGGDWWSTDGSEDFDSDGTADAKQLVACWTRAGTGGSTANEVVPMTWLAAALAGLGCVIVARKRVLG